MYKANLKQMTFALSDALDLVGDNDVYHGKRIAYMASKVAHKLGYTDTEIDDIIIVGLLHDCGISNTSEYMTIIKNKEWKNCDEHCIKGSELLKHSKLYSKYADIVRFHHTPWNTVNTIKKLNKRKKNITNIFYMVGRVDAMKTQNKQYTEIVEFLLNNVGTLFNEAVVNAFIKVSTPLSFWYKQDNENLLICFNEWIHKDTSIEIDEYSYDEIKGIAEMFAYIIDSKSPYTFEHSYNVSQLSLFIADKLGLDEKDKHILELSALLHDLGKLRISNDILEKQGSLDEAEKETMYRHSFDSGTILSKVDAFDEISKIASYHHEYLDGSGYPFKIKGDAIPLLSRIVTISDIFQALAQRRPYRDELTINKCIDIMECEFVKTGKIDPDIMSIVKENKDEMYKIALEAHLFKNS